MGQKVYNVPLAAGAIRSSEAKVRVPGIRGVTGLLIAELSSARRAGAGMECTIVGL